MPLDLTASIQHLLRRTEYVARPERVSALVPLGLNAAIDNILTVTTPVALPPGLDHDIAGMGWEQSVQAKQWWLDRLVDVPKPIQEKMTFFWHGHFTSAWNKVNDTWMMMTQNKLFRDNALGNFVTLTQAIAIDPAMLVYLDNEQNTKYSPNENFGRELLELFTLGIGHYAESDVLACAKAWTGHGIDWTETSPTYLHYKFTSSRHDTTVKTFLGHAFNYNGPDIINEILLNNATARLTAAKFIVGKLWTYFAHPNPPANVVDALAAGFAVDWNIASVLKQMFLRPEFYLPTATQGLVRSPVEWMVALMYHTGFRSADLDPQWYLDSMGQDPFNPPNVAGWKSNAYWINTTTVGARADFAEQVTWWLHGANGGTGHDDLKAMSIPNAIAAVTTLFGLAPLSTVSYNALAGFLTAQRAAAPWGDWSEAPDLMTMSMLAPEMHMA